MKKLSLILFTLFFFFPAIINAVEINDITVVGKENITIGESFTESILISFNDLQQSYQQELGVLYLKYEITFNNEFLTISAIESPDWDSVIYQENDKYYVLSIVNNDNRLQNTCPNSFLSCGDYRATIEFFLNTTTAATSSISIKNPEIALLDMSTYQEEYTYEDIMLKNSSKATDYNLTISQTTISSAITPPQDIVTNLSPDEIVTKITTALNQEPVIADIPSNLLNNLQITDYELDFNKYRNDYTITISEELTSLDLSVILDDTAATYKIIGNENLQNNSKISIEVTSKNNEINTYTINIIKNSSADDLNVTTSSPKLTLKDLYTKYHSYIIYGAIIISVLLVIIIITKIVSKICDKKIEDMTDKF